MGRNGCGENRNNEWENLEKHIRRKRSSTHPGNGEEDEIRTF